MNNLIDKVAKVNGVSADEVEKEIRDAILAGMASDNPSAKAFWKSIAPNGETPDIEDVIAAIVLMMTEDTYFEGTA